MTIEIVEVLSRSTQGHTRPFICRGDDDEIYFVKGVDAGRRDQICEWLAGRLAQLIGLPIAPFTVVVVPEELISGDTAGPLRDLGAGPAFGSRKLSVTELTTATLNRVPAQLQKDVLVFDRWVRNLDRTLTALGGNPNLFLTAVNHTLTPSRERLVVIDHNLAFDSDFNLAALLAHHAFRAQAQALQGDLFSRDEYNARLCAALSCWPDLVAEVPQEWWYLDIHRTLPVNFDAKQALHWLQLYQSDDFWSWS